MLAAAAAARGGLRAAWARAASSAAPRLHAVLEPLDGANEGVFSLTLTRPDAKNAIGRQMLSELREALARLRLEAATRALVVRSATPGAFCAGADLRERASMTRQETAEFVAALRATMGELAALPMPTIAAVDGFALGGGAELALACDLRVVGPGAVFAFPETRLGIIPGAGGTQRLPRVVGTARAKELIFTARHVGADEALRIGLADAAAAPDAPPTGAADARALELAREIAAAAPLALRAAKAAVGGGVEVDVASGLALEAACYAALIPTADRLEGLAAFAEKRRPVWKGE